MDVVLLPCLDTFHVVLFDAADPPESCWYETAQNLPNTSGEFHHCSFSQGRNLSHGEHMRVCPLHYFKALHFK